MIKKNSKLKPNYKALAVVAGIVTMAVILFITRLTNKSIKQSQTIEEFYASKSEDDQLVEEVIVENNPSEDLEIDPKIRELTIIEEEYSVYVNKDGSEIYSILDDKELEEATVEIFTELTATHESEEYLRVLMDDHAYLISRDDISKNRNIVFRNVEDVKRYINKDTKLFVEPSEDSLSVDTKVNEEVSVLGFNEVGFAKVNYKGDILYAKTDILSKERVQIEIVDSNRARNINNSRRSNSQNQNQQVSRSADNNATSQSFNTKGQTYNCSFSAYYPENSRLQGGFNDALGNPLVPANNTCAAPKEIPFGTKILVQGTGTDKDGKIFTVTDRGGAIKMQSDGTWRVDILTHNRDEAYGFGRRSGTVTIVE